MPTEFPLPRGFQPAPVPDRLAFRVGGALRSRPSYLAVRTGFKTASAPWPINAVYWSFRGESNADLWLRRPRRCPVELRKRDADLDETDQAMCMRRCGDDAAHGCLRFGARSGDRTPSCGAYEAPAVPSGSTRKVVRVGGIEPPLSCARGMRFSGLSYTLMATRRGFDPLSPVRQTGRLARCVTGQIGVRGAI